MSFQEELERLLRSRCSLIVIVTAEEPRALQLLTDVCRRRGRPAYRWDLGDGFHPLTEENTPIQSGDDPMAALDQIRRGPENAVYALLDFHDCWKGLPVKRRLRSVAQELVYTKKTVVVVTPQDELPPELKDRAVVLELPLPAEAELEAALDELLRHPEAKVAADPALREKLIQAARGLTYAQAQRVFAKGLVTGGALDDEDVALVTHEKKALLRESQALEFYTLQETPDHVGGLGVLKDWLRTRRRAFSREARAYGLPPPKGMALIGIPGTGKSLSAKMIGSLWGLPLLRLDVGALFGSFVGESEARARKALALAEAVAPCVVWIDEMEKALAQGGQDGGTSQRVFGTILTWMAERRAECFVVATANDISRLPPELLRRGRFDEIFFLDLPTHEERRDILAVHIKRRGRKPENFDLERLAGQSQGYVGAELEQAVIDAMYTAFSQDREFNADDIAAALKHLVPLSISQRERIALLRLWLEEGRAQSASFPDSSQARENYVEVAATRPSSSHAAETG